MATLTVTERGEVTFQDDVLRHLGVRPGEAVTLDLLPGGRAELRAKREPEPHPELRPQPKRSWDDLIGFFEGKTNGANLSIEEINDAIAEAGAAAGRGEL